MNVRIYLFDVDGTLTLPRQLMSKEFESKFNSWIDGKEVYLVTGSDLPKLTEQVPSSIVSKCKGLFCSMGNEYYEGDNLIYQNNIKIPDECLMLLNGYNCSSSYPHERGTKHFEIRSGMVNFSVLGRDTSIAQRQQYYEWDLKNNERQFIANAFNERFNSQGYEARIGGQISLDIQKAGMNKSQAVQYLIAKNKKKDIEFIFFGDKIFSGGNDYDIAEEISKYNIGKSICVTGPNDCLNQLQNMI